MGRVVYGNLYAALSRRCARRAPPVEPLPKCQLTTKAWWHLKRRRNEPTICERIRTIQHSPCTSGALMTRRGTVCGRSDFPHAVIYRPDTLPKFKVLSQYARTRDGVGQEKKCDGC